MYIGEGSSYYQPNEYISEQQQLQYQQLQQFQQQQLQLQLQKIQMQQNQMQQKQPSPSQKPHRGSFSNFTTVIAPEINLGPGQVQPKSYRLNSLRYGELKLGFTINQSVMEMQVLIDFQLKLLRKLITPQFIPDHLC